jgi:mono/diheme cytochrome c family protein
MKSLAPAFLVSLGLSSSLLNAADDPAIDFVRQIKPIFAERCIECHNSETLNGELNLQNRDLAMKKRKNGPVIVPKEPEKSMLYMVLTLPPADKKAMPATAHRIPKTDIQIIRRWIEEGAKWPEGKDGAIPVKTIKPKGV